MLNMLCTANRMSRLRGIGAPEAEEDDLPPLMLAVAGQGISVVRGMLEVCLCNGTIRACLPMT